MDLKLQPLGFMCCPLDEGGRNPQLAVTRLQMCRFGWRAWLPAVSFPHPTVLTNALLSRAGGLHSLRDSLGKARWRAG